MAEHDLEGELDAFLAGHQAELVDFRRDLHAHPEIGYHEHRTTRRIKLRLEAAGLRPRALPKGTRLRVDLHALPLSDEKNVPYRSTVPNACHACGHDVHTTVLLGTGLFLARTAAAGALPGRVRLIFQPAEEVPCGALDVLAAGGIASVDRVFALHCDPRLDVGKIGTRVGAITAACDKISVRVTGPGGHTAPTASCRPRRAWAGRTSPGTWSRFRVRWPGSAPGSRAPVTTLTSTSPRSTLTSGRSGSASSSWRPPR